MHRIQTHYPGFIRPIPIFSEPGFFFNEEDQLRQQDNGSFHLLTALNTATHLADARCAVFVDNELAISPKLAPFGSVEFISALPERALTDLLDSLESQVHQLGLPVLRLTNYPHCYAPQQAGRLAYELERRAYEVTDQLINFHLDVTGEPLAPRMHLSERRRLAKCKKANLDVTRWVAPPVQQVIQFIQQSRNQQGYPLTISVERLTYLLQQFPDQYPVFVVRDGSTIAALTVAVRVRQDILYNFLPADNMAYRSFSPAVLLTDGLYSYCQQENITLLDLGVSVDEYRLAKPGLMEFKRRLGAQESAKMVWEKCF
ncbi:GNAT family N-acetyltransferase [Fibrella forsythiae]|uniref:GNAT family N-acetyltransferase n=1 Tax=Fibrella forsythiae TaxID=2817061 RepID=A0ABS3JNE5_9BACT|nr:GNAT family N-acetyltransferase [Fibrella forsythiae]MBO0950998.1 GNAT family N-acetyltransferase [Fibrella forsythiae]